MSDSTHSIKTKILIHTINPNITIDMYFSEKEEAIKIISDLRWNTVNDLILVRDTEDNVVFIPYCNIGLIEVI